MYSYAGFSNSVYVINGELRSKAFGTSEHQFCGTLRARGRKTISNTVTGNPGIKGNIYVEGEEVDAIENKKIDVSV